MPTIAPFSSKTVVDMQMKDGSRSKHQVQGLWPAVLTPLQANGSVDVARLVTHGQRLLAAGCDGLTLFGTTGEGTAFSVLERMQVADALIASGMTGKQLIINLTALARSDAVQLGAHALKIGARAGMLMPPFYYNAQHDAGLMAYVSEVIEAVHQADVSTEAHSLPIILYHFPSLSGVGFSAPLIEQLLQKYPRQIVGLKDSSADVEHSKQLAQRFPKLGVLVGCEPDVAPTMCVGGAGSICGLANIEPALMRRVMDAPDRVSSADAQRMREVLALLSIEPGMPFVSAYKAMLAEQLGDEAWLRVRAPLTALSTAQTEKVRRAYKLLLQSS
jgi:4-hydroxy-tetrahydrodipicolinate synthase